MRRTRSSAGFTLVEVMIVVALLGVLASVAIPSFVTYQARTRRSEAFVNLSAVARSQVSFQATKGYFYGTGLSWPDPVPYGGLGAHRMTWDAASEGAFAELGWAPEGQVYYSYETNTPDVPGSGCSCEVCFSATAFGDVDRNGQVSPLRYSHPEPDGGCGFDECPSRLFPFWAPTRIGSSDSVYDEVAINRANDEF
jgi:prepilin-type N-terminal cleavage/methylation domain-containing protein